MPFFRAALYTLADRLLPTLSDLTVLRKTAEPIHAFGKWEVEEIDDMADRYDWDRERMHDRGTERDRERPDWDRNREFDRQNRPNFDREGGREDYNRDFGRHYER